MERKSMGSFIAALRKVNGLTQKDLAEKLNVSDKSVSRWERDESAPDLSLIPVLAEIFAITSDELLRGERKPSSAQAQPDAPHPRTEKQRQHLLAVSLSQYKSKSLIASGLAVCGLIVAATGNFAFIRAYMGFFAGAVFFLSAVIVQVIFTNAAFLTVSDSEYDDVEIGRFKYSVIFLAEKTIGLAFTLFGATLPLIVAVQDAYAGLSTKFFLQQGLVLGFLAFLLCFVVSHFLNHFFIKNGVYTLDEKRAGIYHHNHKLKGRCALGLVAVLAVTLLLNGVLTAWGASPALAKGTVFEDFDSFKAYMEQDIAYDPTHGYAEAPAPAFPNAYYDEYGNTITEEEALTRTITDDAGNVLCTFVLRNQSVWSWRYSTTQFLSINDLTNGTVPGVLPITVYTHSDIDLAQQQAGFISAVFVAIYLLECCAALFVYYHKRRRK